jgi:TP901 family phage tail tape measure protein
MELDPLVLPLRTDDQTYSSGLTGAEKRLDSAARKMRNVGTAMSLAVTAPLALLGRQAVNAFADFDEAMTNSISIMSGVTPEIRSEMEETAKVIAQTTRTSATDAAEAYYFLASAGLNAKDSIAALPQVQKFATAGNFNMAKATDLATDAQSALGLAVGTTDEKLAGLTRVTDSLVKASTLANATVEQFSLSLTTKAGAALSLLNKDVEEGVAVLAAYADIGIKGELAGERLDIMLRELQKSSINNAEAWDEMGISLYDSQGNMKPLVNILEDLNGKVGDMSDEQRNATFTAMGFRAQSMGAITPLLAVTDKIRRYEKELRNAGGTTEEVAKKQMTSFSAQMDVLKNQMNLAAIEAGQFLAPAILQLNTHIANGLTWWRSLSDETKKWTLVAVKLTAALGPTLVLLSRIIKVAQFIVAIANPWSIALAGVAAAVAGITYAVGGPSGMSEVWDKAKTYVGNFVAAATGFLKNFSTNVSILITWLGENWGLLLVDMIAAWATFTMNMVQNALVVVKTMTRVFIAFLGWLYETSTKFWRYIFSDEFQAAVWNGLSGALTAIGDWVLKAWEALKSFASGFAEIVISAGNAAAEILFAIPGTFIAIVIETLSQFKQAVKAVLDGEWPDISNMLAQVGDAAMKEFDDAAEAIGKTVDKVGEKVGAALGDVTEQVTVDFQAGMEDPNFFNTAKDIISEGIDELKSPLEGFNAQVTTGPAFVGMETHVAQMDDLDEAGKKAANMYDEAGQGLDQTGDKAGAAADAVGDLDDQLGKKKKVSVDTSGFDALDRYSREALVSWTDYQDAISGPLTPSQSAGNATATDGNTSQEPADKANELLGRIAENTSNVMMMKVQTVGFRRA